MLANTQCTAHAIAHISSRFQGSQLVFGLTGLNSCRALRPALARRQAASPQRWASLAE